MALARRTLAPAPGYAEAFAQARGALPGAEDAAGESRE